MWDFRVPAGAHLLDILTNLYNTNVFIFVYVLRKAVIINRIGSKFPCFRFMFDDKIDVMHMHVCMYVVVGRYGILQNRI